MELQDLNFFASVIALIISLVTLIRTRKAQEWAKLHSEYIVSPKLSLRNMELSIFDGKDNQPAFDFSAELNNHSSTAIKIIGVYVEYGSEMDPEKREREKIFGPTYISEKDSKFIEASGSTRNVESVSSKFELLDVQFWLTIVIRGVSGVEMTTRYFLFHQEVLTNTISTRCPHKEFALDPCA